MAAILSTSFSMGCKTRKTKSGLVPPSTITPARPLTKQTAISPKRSHPGWRPTVHDRIKKAIAIMMTKPLSIVSCIKSAALVARPAGIFLRAASSTTRAVPARFIEGATVLTKKVPKTNLMPSVNLSFSLTARKQATKAPPCEVYLPSCAITAKTRKRGAPCLMVSRSFSSWSPRMKITAKTMTTTTPASILRRFFFMRFLYYNAPSRCRCCSLFISVSKENVK